MEKTIPTTIRIPESLKHDLEKKAASGNRSLNNLINIILQLYIKENKPNSKE